MSVECINTIIYDVYILQVVLMLPATYTCNVYVRVLQYYLLCNTC